MATSGTTSASSTNRRSSDSSRTAVAAGAVEHARDQPQRVHGGEHDRRRTDRGVAPALREDAGEDRELAGEVGRAGNGERQHPDDHHDRGESRAALREPSEVGEAVGAGALDQHRGEQEHRSGDEAVADRVEDRAVEAEVVRREDTRARSGSSGPSTSTRSRRGRPAGGTRAASRRRGPPRRARARPCASPRPAPGSAGARSRRARTRPPSRRRPRGARPPRAEPRCRRSRSQPWNGSSGAFTAKATRKPRKTQSLPLVPASIRLNVPCESPKATIEASISSEPAIV